MNIDSRTREEATRADAPATGTAVSTTSRRPLQYAPTPTHPDKTSRLRLPPGWALRADDSGDDGSSVARPSVGLASRARIRRAVPPVGQSAVSITVRLLAAVALSALAFPALPVAAYNAVRLGVGGAAQLTLVCSTAIAMVCLRARRAVGEPQVHDRQLDVILALPFLAAAGWLALAWPNHPTMGGPLSDRAVIGFTTFVIGACLLMLGTRFTARIRCALPLPLLAAPVITASGALWSALYAAAVLMLAWIVVRRVVRGTDPLAAHRAAIRYAPSISLLSTVLVVMFAVTIGGAPFVLDPSLATHWALLVGSAQ